MRLCIQCGVRKTTTRHARCGHCRLQNLTPEQKERYAAKRREWYKARNYNHFRYERNKDRYDNGEVVIPDDLVCAICHETKPNTEFYTVKGASKGRDRYCKPCRSAYMRQYYHRKKENADG